MNRKARRSVAVFSVLIAALVAGAACHFVSLRPSFDPDRASRYYAAPKVPQATLISTQQVREAIARSAE